MKTCKDGEANCAIDQRRNRYDCERRRQRRVNTIHDEGRGACGQHIGNLYVGVDIPHAVGFVAAQRMRPKPFQSRKHIVDFTVSAAVRGAV